MTGCQADSSLSRQQFQRIVCTSLAKMGRLRADGLRGTVSYSDGQFDDARYSLALVQSCRPARALKF